MRILISTLLLVALSFSATAQFNKPPKDIIERAPKWAQLMYADNPNFFEIEQAFRAYYKDKEVKKNMHTRNYKFFRRLVKHRIQNDGSIAPKSHPNYQAALKKKQTRSSEATTVAGNWSLIGPIESKSAQGNPSSNQTCVYTIDQSLSNSNILYCGTQPGEVYKSTDGGDNWVNVSMDLVLPFGEAVTSVVVHPTNPNTVYFSVQDMIYQTTNGGTTWSQISSINTGGSIEKILIHPTQTNTMFVAGSGGLFRSNNGGANWTTVFSDFTFDIEVNTTSDNIIYALKRNDAQNLPEFLSSTDFGQNFTVQTNGWYNSTDSAREFEIGRIAVSPANSNRVYALLYGQAKDGDYGYIGVYRSNDGGSSWTLPNGPSGGPYTASHPNLASLDGLGETPDNIVADASFCALAVDANDADKLLIGGLNLWRSDDGGATFEALGGYIDGPFNDEVNTSGIHVDQQEYKVFGNTTWLTTDGGIYKSTDFFSTSNFEKKNKGVHSTDFWGFGSGWNQDILVAGVYHNGVMAYNESYGAGIYLDLENGAGEPSTGYVNPGQNNLVYATDIGGVVIPDVIGPTTFFSDEFIPNESYNPIDEGYSDFVFHPNCYSIAYAGFLNDLWKTTDKGQTFQKIQTFGTVEENFITSIHISRKDPNMMYLMQRLQASNKSKMWKSTDAGVNWSEITTIPSNLFGFTMLQVDPYDPTKIWLASSSLGSPSLVFKSEDSGTTWTNITSPTIADEFAMTLDYIPGTSGGIYLGTNLGIYYKNDNMANWLDFSDGLPEVAATRKSRPFYRDNQLRLSSQKGMWQSELHERPDQPFAQIMVNDLDTCMTTGATYRFVDYSILKHDGASWEWSFEGGTPSTASNWFADVVFNTPGMKQVVLKITDDRGLIDRDTLNINIRASSLNLSITFDQFGDETTWDIKNADSDIIASGGPYMEGSTTYSETISCPGSGCFTFTMYDSLDDGICCGAGNGSYTLTDGNGMVLASGGEFTDEITHSFCLCKETDFITGAIPSNTFSVNNLLESNGQVNNPEMVNFNAGNEIELQADFEVQVGAMFLAQITPCMSTINFLEEDENTLKRLEQANKFGLKFHKNNSNFALFELTLPTQHQQVSFGVWNADETIQILEREYKFTNKGKQFLRLDHDNLPKGDYHIKVFSDSFEKMVVYKKE